MRGKFPAGGRRIRLDLLGSLGSRDNRCNARLSRKPAHRELEEGVAARDGEFLERFRERNIFLCKNLRAEGILAPAPFRQSVSRVVFACEEAVV